MLLSLLVCPGCKRTPRHEDIPKNATISLQIRHALRIPHNTIIVQVEYVNGQCLLQADTKPMEGELSSNQYPPFHNVKTLSKKWYEEFSGLLSSLHWNNLRKKEADIVGLDGSTWALTCKQDQTENTVTIWSPDYETKKRNLQDFQEVCEFLLKTADIDPNTSTPQTIGNRNNRGIIKNK